MTDARIYPWSVVVFTVQAFCIECEEPYLHCLRMVGGAVRSRPRPGLQPTVREQREAVSLDYTVFFFRRDRVTAESGVITNKVNSSCRLSICVGGLASAEIVNHDSKVHETSLL